MTYKNCALRNAHCFRFCTRSSFISHSGSILNERLDQAGGNCLFYWSSRGGRGIDGLQIRDLGNGLILYMNGSDTQHGMNDGGTGDHMGGTDGSEIGDHMGEGTDGSGTGGHMGATIGAGGHMIGNDSGTGGHMVDMDSLKTGYQINSMGGGDNSGSGGMMGGGDGSGTRYDGRQRWQRDWRSHGWR